MKNKKMIKNILVYSAIFLMAFGSFAALIMAVM